MQIRQRIFKCADVWVLLFSRQNLETFDISHTFLSLTVAKLSALKNSPVFGLPCSNSSTYSQFYNYIAKRVKMAIVIVIVVVILVNSNCITVACTAQPLCIFPLIHNDSKGVTNLSRNFLLILNFRKIYNPISVEFIILKHQVIFSTCIYFAPSDINNCISAICTVLLLALCMYMYF